MLTPGNAKRHGAARSILAAKEIFLFMHYVPVVRIGVKVDALLRRKLQDIIIAQLIQIRIY